MGMAADTVFEGGSVARGEKEEGRGGGSAWVCHTVEGEGRREGGSMQGWRPDHAVGMASGDAGRWGAGVTDKRNRVEARPSGQRPVCEIEREREAGWQWGVDMRARVAQCRAVRFKFDLN
jgi:hypothetical protein